MYAVLTGTETAPSLGTQSFTMPQTATWNYNGYNGPPASPATYSRNAVEGGAMMGPVCINWGLSGSGASWTGYLQWYTTAGTNTVFGGLPTSVTYVTFVNNSTATNAWYYTNLMPSSPR